MYDDERFDRVTGSRRPRSVRGGSQPAVAAVSRELAPRELAPRELRRPGRAGLRPRQAHGPRPVRPSAVPVSVRPAQGERPACPAEPASRVQPSRQRTLARRAQALPVGSAAPGRRVLAGLVVAALAAAVVVGWGQLLAATGGSSAPAAGSAAVVVTVGAEETVWDVARRVEPGAEGAQLSAVAERIVVANSLSSVELQVGQVLRVPSD